MIPAAISPLSPLAAQTIKARALANDDADSPENNEIEEVVLYRCPKCKELHEWESDAKACCNAPANQATSAPTCPVFLTDYNNHRDAADCCLWKDLDAATRHRIADEVEAGGSWKEALGLDAFGMPRSNA